MTNEELKAELEAKIAAFEGAQDADTAQYAALELVHFWANNNDRVLFMVWTDPSPLEPEVKVLTAHYTMSDNDPN